MVGWKKFRTAFDRQVQPLACDWHGGLATGGTGRLGLQPVVHPGVGGTIGGCGGA